MAGRGGAIPGNGRKSKAEEARMRDKVSPYVKNAIETVVNIMMTASRDADRLAAAKLIIAYYAGQPPQSVELSGHDNSNIVVQFIKQQTDAANQPSDDLL